MKYLISSRIVWTMLIALFAASTVGAQTTIFNIPSTDIVAPGKTTVETDFIGHAADWSNGGFQTFGVRAIYGFRRKLETGANVFYTRFGGGVAPVEAQLNAKYRFFSREKYGFATTAGTQLFVPLNRAAGKRTYVMVYANASLTIKKTRGTRLTGGFYSVAAAPTGFGTKNGALAAVEQPLKGKLSIVADWYSGRNRFGYAAGGFMYALPRNQYVMAGYNFGNSGRGNNSLAVYYGATF